MPPRRLSRRSNRVAWTTATLLYDTRDGLFQCLQLVQNAAARLVTDAHRRDHITPVLRQLHWLPVRQWAVFEIAGLVHQPLAGVAPVYWAHDCRLLSDAGRRPLRSNSNDMWKLLVPRTHNKLGIGLSRLPVLYCGMTSHPDYSDRDSPSTSSDDLRKLISLATEALSDSWVISAI